MRRNILPVMSIKSRMTTTTVVRTCMGDVYPSWHSALAQDQTAISKLGMCIYDHVMGTVTGFWRGSGEEIHVRCHANNYRNTDGVLHSESLGEKNRFPAVFAKWVRKGSKWMCIYASASPTLTRLSILSTQTSSKILLLDDDMDRYLPPACLTEHRTPVQNITI